MVDMNIILYQKINRYLNRRAAQAALLAVMMEGDYNSYVTGLRDKKRCAILGKNVWNKALSGRTLNRYE